MKTRLLPTACLLFCLCALRPTLSHAQPADGWIPIPREAKPYTRWWWLGSAVDSAGLRHSLEELARAGIGGVEITPIYGVQDNEKNEIPYLSPRWMKMLEFVEQQGERLGVEIDMATGTGWPFGGPGVPLEQAACKAVFHGSRLEIGRTRQKVKRAAPGGEGYVIDHFDRDAVRSYLATFETAFTANRTPRPHTFFNDSYEVYGADWTPGLLAAFAARRGYKLEDHFDTFLLSDSLCAVLGGDTADLHRRLLSDYRETLGELLLENFTTQWTEWAHRGGSITRNQAHGSPANLLDVYAAVDIPECEGFGLSDFGIKGLRTDAGFTKKNFSDISMLKYASSAAHVAGKPLTSSETFTWLTEHFRTSLSQCKPDLDLMFLAGVNHVFFHGTCYSPKDEPWPGWRFYASVDMSPYNPQWNAMPAFASYIARCQAFLQWGEPDNDFLVYLPFYDMIYEQPGRLALFDIHSMEQRAPKFIATIQGIIRNGYDVDYISDRHLLNCAATDGRIHCHPDSPAAASVPYSAIIVPDVRFMPLQTLRHLLLLANTGARIVFIGHYPQGVPGHGRRLAGEQAQFDELVGILKEKTLLAATYEEAASAARGRRETMRTRHGLSCIRRSNPQGHHYFISNLSPDDTDADVALGVPFQRAVRYDPMTGDVRPLHAKGNAVRLRLASGESTIIRTFRDGAPGGGQPASHPADTTTLELRHWTLTFPTAAPTPVTRAYRMDAPTPWTALGDTALLTTMATGRYACTFSGKPLGKALAKGAGRPTPRIVLDLGDVRESARIVLNGKEVATLFAVPFRCDITPYVKKGRNRLEVHVTNLPANRIAQMDRDRVPWRRFKEINVVDLNYQRTTYAAWPPVPSGLCSPVRIHAE